MDNNQNIAEKAADKIKDFISQKPYLFGLLVIGIIDIALVLIILIFAFTISSEFLQVISVILLIGILAIYICAYIFRKLAQKKNE